MSAPRPDLDPHTGRRGCGNPCTSGARRGRGMCAVGHKAGMATSKLRRWKHQPGSYRLLSFSGNLSDPRCLPHDVCGAHGLLAQMHPLDIAADWKASVLAQIAVRADALTSLPVGCW